ncbi:unnamed protein product, partial [Prorocentrum cordatum]
LEPSRGLFLALQKLRSPPANGCAGAERRFEAAGLACGGAGAAPPAADGHQRIGPGQGGRVLHQGSPGRPRRQQGGRARGQAGPSGGPARHPVGQGVLDRRREAGVAPGAERPRGGPEDPAEG